MHFGKFIAAVAALVMVGCASAESVQQAEVGKLDIYEDFKSDYIPARDVLVWLPEGYSPEQKYAVLYMHDGQMLFDESVSWNKQSWNVDRVANEVLKDGRCRPFIVVGIDNTDNRLTEYMPEKALEYIPADDALLQKFERSAFVADDYLRFIVEELKPFIDERYSTLTDKENTVVMGSSMGGLISLYALAEYPEVFGGAGCLSTHSPMAVADVENEAPVWSKAFRDYLTETLPEPNSHLIYMDYGDQTIDAGYAEYQQKLDELFVSLGWSEPCFVSLFFEGHAHDETSWSSRLDIPLEMLLSKE